MVVTGQSESQAAYFVPSSVKHSHSQAKNVHQFGSSIFESKKHQQKCSVFELQQAEETLSKLCVISSVPFIKIKSYCMTTNHATAICIRGLCLANFMASHPGLWPSSRG